MLENKRLVCYCAGGYGSQLQANYLLNYNPSILYLHDDFIDYDKYKDSYDSFNKEKLNTVVTDDDFIVPSYSLNNHPLDNKYVKDYTKLNLYNFFDSNYVIPYYDLENGLIFKPISGSGSKNIDFISKKDYVAQIYCDSDELIADCALVGDTIFAAPRKSLKRINGRDTVVSFNISDIDYMSLIRILHNFNYKLISNGKLFFNIQCRKHNKIWKVMELDFRLSGSSIINSLYPHLIESYINNNDYNEKFNSFKIINSKLNIYVGKPTFNYNSLEIFNKLGLSIVNGG